MSVLGHGKGEPLAVHIVKSYCLPVLLYGCEIGKMSPSDRHKVDVTWNNCFRKILMLVGGKVPNHYCFTAILCLYRFSLIKGKFL